MHRVQGYLMLDGNGKLWVQSAATFYDCSKKLITNTRACEHDTITCDIQHNRVIKVIKLETAPRILRPKGFPSPKGVSLGTVTSYSKGVGTLDGTHSFTKSVVKCLPGAEVEVGELVEFIVNDTGSVVKITGHFDTCVGAWGKRVLCEESCSEA